MPDASAPLAPSLAGLPRTQWLTRMSEIGAALGSYRSLGSNHFAVHVHGDDTLLITFETEQGIRALDAQAHPIGWHMAQTQGWSHLSIISQGDTWFRNEAVYAYFDELADDGMFDPFARVVAYGAGPCGYAAAAFSVAAPGATVLAVQPQATLDPEIAGWDMRFLEQRILEFTGRYGYAPDMLDAASRGFILFDPLVTLDAMHAALFTKPHVTKLPMRHFGTALQTQLLDMDMLAPLLRHAADGTLTRSSFARLLRARREHIPYLRALMAATDLEGRDVLTQQICRNVTARMTAPKFARRLRALTETTPERVD